MGAVTAAVIGGVAAVGGAAMSANAAKKGAESANQAQANAVAQWAGLDAPNVSEQELDLLLPELVGQYNPEMQSAETLQDSAQVQDPAIKQMQMKALEDMAAISEGGLREEDLAAYRDMRRTVEGENQANQEKILQDMQRRGTLSSGMELAAKLQANQAATDRLSQGSDRLTQEANARALQALSQTGNMGSQLTSQNFQEQQARDAINKFNMANKQDIGNANVTSRNQAQATNLAARQAMADQQTAMKNRQQEYNKQLLQQQFQNQATLAAGRSGQYQAQANAMNQQAAQQAQSGAQMGVGAANALTGIVSAIGANQQRNTNIDNSVNTMMNDSKNKGIF